MNEQTAYPAFSKKDMIAGVVSGLLIGTLSLPVLRAAKPTIYEQVSLMIIPFFLIATPFGLAIAYLIGKKLPVIWQLGKFGVTGVLNVLVDLGVLSALTFLMKAYFNVDSKGAVIAGLSVLTFYSLYKSISFIIANINSFFWNKYWTFNQDGEKKTEFFQFFLVSIVGFLINVFVASFVFKFVQPVAGLNSDQWGLIGAGAGSVVGLVWNFMGYKFIVFKK
jgi:putative flippase GtrA